MAITKVTRTLLSTGIDDQSNATAITIDSSENVGIGNSSPLGKLTISNAAGANAPTTVTAANTYLQLGSDDYGASNNGKFMIGFGYTDATNTNSPAYIGYEETSSSGDTKGELTFYTRDVITDTAPSERMRIDSSGSLLVNTTSAGSNRLKIVGDASRYGILSENLSGYGAFSLKSTTVAQTWSIGAVDNGSNSDLFIYGGSSAGTKVTLDSSGNVLVGKTSSAFNTAGVQLQSNGELYATRDGGTVVSINRKTSDGAIVNFAKDGTTVGSIGASSGTTYIQGNSNSSGFLFGNSNVYPWDAGALSDANIDLGEASYRWNNIYLSGGAYLGGTGSANKLDDYEEGTWTPSCGATLSTAIGHYTKIGNQVTVHYHVVTTGGLPSSTVQVQIYGLPFTSNSSSLTAAPIYARYYTPNDSTLTSLVQDSETQIRLINTNEQNFDYTIWGELEASANNSVFIIGSVTYIV